MDEIRKVTPAGSESLNSAAGLLNIEGLAVCHPGEHRKLDVKLSCSIASPTVADAVVVPIAAVVHEACCFSMAFFISWSCSL